MQRVERRELIYTTATAEGMTQETNKRRRTTTTPKVDESVRIHSQVTTKKKSKTKTNKVGRPKKSIEPVIGKTKSNAKTTPATAKTNTKTTSTTVASASASTTKRGRKKTTPLTKPSENPLKLYEKHMREWTRRLLTLQRQDPSGRFWDDAPEDMEEEYEKKTAPRLPPYHPPYNWEMFHRRMDAGFYTKQRYEEEQEKEQRLFGDYYLETGQSQGRKTHVSCPQRIDWERMHADITGMFQLRKELASIDPEEVPTSKNSVTWAATKLEEVSLYVNGRLNCVNIPTIERVSHHDTEPNHCAGL